MDALTFDDLDMLSTLVDAARNVSGSTLVPVVCLAIAPQQMSPPQVQ
jgi:hypothetical protein